MPSDFKEFEFVESVKYYAKGTEQIFYVTEPTYSIERECLCIKVGEKIYVDGRVFARVMVLTVDTARNLITQLQKSLDNNKGVINAS